MSVFEPMFPNPVSEPYSNTGKYNSHMLLIKETALMIYTGKCQQQQHLFPSLSNSPCVHTCKQAQGSKDALLRALFPLSFLSQIQQQLLQQVHAHRQEVDLFPPFCLEIQFCGRNSCFGLSYRHVKADAASTAIPSLFQEKVSAAYHDVLCDGAHISSAH